LLSLARRAGPGPVEADQSAGRVLPIGLGVLVVYVVYWVAAALLLHQLAS